MDDFDSDVEDQLNDSLGGHSSTAIPQSGI